MEIPFTDRGPKKEEVCEWRDRIMAVIEELKKDGENTKKKAREELWKIVRKMT